MAEQPWRLFIAVALPQGVADACVYALRSVRARYPEARWIRAEDLHITLLFLGSVGSGEADRVAAAVRNVAAGEPPFEASLDRGGGRSRRDGDGVAWLTVATGADHLGRVSKALAAQLQPDRTAAIRAPHVTVARGASAALIADIGDVRPVEPHAWRVDRLHLMRSQLEPTGARYESIAEAVLGGRSGPESRPSGRS